MSASSSQGFATLLDGKALSQTMRAEFAKTIAALTARGLTPTLAVILVGTDSASEVYVRNKIKACHAHGFASLHKVFPADISQEKLFAEIAQLNEDATVHGILVQLPLPPPLNPASVLAHIAPHKDVDGFHVENAGCLLLNRPGFRPCTPYGVMKLLAAYDIAISGKHAVVVGASNIVGKPQALMLLQAGATVSICHSKTQDLSAHTRQADILVVATGKPHLITADMVKPGACVVDVGIHRNTSRKLFGDVDFDAVGKVAAYITPVPGGVGPMTITMLLANTLEAAEQGAAEAVLGAK